MKTIDEIYSHFRQLIKKYFANLPFNGSGYAGADFHAHLSTKNRHFQDTPYFYREPLTFTHWTSINNLMSILNNREIRLYNLYNSEDKDEFAFAANIVGIPETQIDLAKKYYYAFSFCKQEDLSNPYLWQQYGKDYEGVAIEFTIENNPADWDNFMLSQVYYETPESFAEYEKEAAILKNQYGLNIDLNMQSLIGFHKKKDFHNEHEVRLSIYSPYKYIEEHWKFVKHEFRIDSTGKRNRITNYIALPLWVDNDSAYIKSDRKELDRSSPYDDDYFLTRPKMKIANIHLGKRCGIEFSDFFKYRQVLNDLIRLNLGYQVDLSINLYGN